MNLVKDFPELLILDFSRYLPGGYGTQPFADWGSQVIKVEDTGQGDFCRHDSPTRHGISYYSTATCRNKKSISLNLKDAEAQQYCLELIRDADILIESFRPGVTKKLGIDYDTTRKENPGLIYLSISGYGQSDARSLKPMHDLNMQAHAGYLSLTDDNAFPLPLVDYATAMVTTQALLAALVHRDATDEGCYIDISMFDCFVWWQSMIDSRWCFNGGVHKRQDLEYPSVGYNLYETKDNKYLAFAMIEPKFWEPFVEEVGLPELKTECRKRLWQAPEAYEKLKGLIQTKTYDEWCAWLEDKDYSISPVLSKDEAIADLLENKPDLISYVDFPNTGKVLQTNIPHHISTMPTSIETFEETHLLGQDTREVLEGLNVPEDAIDAMLERGAIRIEKTVDKSIKDNNYIYQK